MPAKVAPMIIAASLLAFGSAGLLILGIGWSVSAESASQGGPGSASACL